MNQKKNAQNQSEIFAESGKKNIKLEIALIEVPFRPMFQLKTSVYQLNGEILPTSLQKLQESKLHTI